MEESGEAQKKKKSGLLRSVAACCGQEFLLREHGREQQELGRARCASRHFFLFLSLPSCLAFLLAYLLSCLPAPFLHWPPSLESPQPLTRRARRPRTHAAALST